MLSWPLFQGTAKIPSIRTSTLLQDIGILIGTAIEILGQKKLLSFSQFLEGTEALELKF